MSGSQPYRPVLVITRNVRVCNALVRVLESGGYHAVGARSGRQGFDLLRRGLRPCAILIDLGLPGISGERFHVLHERDPQLAPIPLIVFSRHDGRAAARQPGVVILSDPIDRARVLSLVEQHCAKDLP